jgi:uncharacterized protein (DUF305 family)
MTRKNLVRMALAVLTTGLVLAGCSSNDMGNMGSMSSPTTSGSAAAAPAGQHNEADVAFTQGMIPHHEGAIEMAKLVQGRTTNAKIVELASRIEKAQDPEIVTMKGWLKAWGAEAASGSMPGMNHGSSMPGMTDPQEMAKLEQAKNADFDKVFLDMMIKHHQGAIDMANTEVKNGSSAEAKKLAQQIIESQQAEITEMKGLLTAGG